jgi:uncharacterized protein with HEPN domain
VLVHGYFDIDLDIVWTAIDVNLPDFKNQILSVLSELDRDNAPV